MINYNKNELINECLVKFYETFALTLDTADYVPERFNKKILKYIFKNMRRQFRRLNGEDRRYQLIQRAKENESLKRSRVETTTQNKAKRRFEKLQAPLLKFKARQKLKAQKIQAKAEFKQYKADFRKQLKQSKRK